MPELIQKQIAALRNKIEQGKRKWKLLKDQQEEIERKKFDYDDQIRLLELLDIGLYAGQKGRITKEYALSRLHYYRKEWQAVIAEGVDIKPEWPAQVRRELEGLRNEIGTIVEVQSISRYDGYEIVNLVSNDRIYYRVFLEDLDKHVKWEDDER